jgi:hypothetical protein
LGDARTSVHPTTALTVTLWARPYHQMDNWLLELKGTYRKKWVKETENQVLIGL